MIFNLYGILKWFERTWRFWLGLVFVCNIAYLIHSYRNIPPPAPVVAVQDSQLEKRIEALEKQVQDQQKVISWYDTYNQSSQTNFKRLDKNQQNQIDVS